MPAPTVTYTFLGPEGTFTEAALMQVPDAAEAIRIPSSNVNTALDKVRDGSADAAMVPIENSVEGGVTATLDAIATGQELRILREALVPISFVLVARPGMAIGNIRRVSTHGHAWAQCRLWVDANANLSIANMDFADFADAADVSGTFRGFDGG
ncbi:prephenate dehydratase domain-containing protein, partial [Streptomyces sp. NPDC002082]|uniref:prephenate dehydratase domain-containing protein n=1 Tax=Streptomyces sp. NPDC002082 TaxID=3154772 RepID=UPI003332F3B2